LFLVFVCLCGSFVVVVVVVVVGGGGGGCVCVCFLVGQTRRPLFGLFAPNIISDVLIG